MAAWELDSEDSADEYALEDVEEIGGVRPKFLFERDNEDLDSKMAETMPRETR